LVGVGIIEERESLKNNQESYFNFCEKVEQGEGTEEATYYIRSSLFKGPAFIQPIRAI